MQKEDFSDDDDDDEKSSSCGRRQESRVGRCCIVEEGLVYFFGLVLLKLFEVEYCEVVCLWLFWDLRGVGVGCEVQGRGVEEFWGFVWGLGWVGLGCVELS